MYLIIVALDRFCHELEEWWRKLSNECLKLDTAIGAFAKAQRKLLSLKERLIREEIVLEEKGKVGLFSLSCLIFSLHVYRVMPSCWFR